MSALKNFSKIAHITILSLLVFILFGVIGGIVVSRYFLPQLPSTAYLKEVRLHEPLRVYTRNGLLIGEFGDKRRIPIHVDQIPPLMIKAVLAAEDDRFYEHPGIDLKAILRAFVSLIKTGEIRQGASTITMQVARNFFLTSERTFIRKLKEMLLAYKIEEKYSKKDILGLYLNKIYFGNHAYGIGAAAQVYYGRDIRDLTLAEWAILAGVPKFPSSSNPLSNPSRAMTRRNYILTRMYNLGYIRQNEYEAAIKTKNTADLHRTQLEAKVPYVAEMARTYMEKRFGENYSINGYKVTTTIDVELQKSARVALRTTLLSYNERHGYHGVTEHHTLPEEDLTDIKKVEQLAKELLSPYKIKGGLVPSLVLKVNKQSVVAYNRWADIFEIEWEDIVWARRYISENRRGRTPRSAHELFKQGDIIRVRLVKISSPEKEQETKGSGDSKKKNAETENVEDNNPPKSTVRWRLAEIPKAEGALVSIRPDDGAIMALVGGFDFYHSKFNRVTQAERQAGSNFKPFIYSAALEHGFTAASMIKDGPIVIDTGLMIWRPQNYNKNFYGPMTIRKALALSRNLVSIRLLDKVGVKNAINHAVKFGFKRNKIPHNLTTALGTGTVTPLELATGFSVFANGGYLVKPYFIQKVEDADGKIICQANPITVCHNCASQNIMEMEQELHLALDDEEDKDRAFIDPPPTELIDVCAEEDAEPRYAPRTVKAQNVWIMNSILKDVIQIGTARQALKLQRPDIAGKTGTTDDFRDAWFSGFTPDIVTTVWVGFDRPHSLGKKESGGRAALPMWIDFMAKALENIPIKSLTPPPGLVTAHINPNNGLLARSTDSNAVLETFYQNTVPSRYGSYSNSYSNSHSGTVTRTKKRTTGTSSAEEMEDSLF